METTARPPPVKTVLEAAVRMQDLVFMFVGGGMGKRDVEETIAWLYTLNRQLTELVEAASHVSDNEN